MVKNFPIRSIHFLCPKSGMTPGLIILAIILPALLYLSCSRDSKDPGELMTAYCIRECVLETSDAEICDTKCKCAVEKLADDLGGEFADRVNQIVEDGPRAGEYAQRFKSAFAECPGIK